MKNLKLLILVGIIAIASILALTQGKKVETEPITSLPLPSEIHFLRDGDVWTSTLDGKTQKQITHLGDIQDYWILEGPNLLIEKIKSEPYSLVAELLEFNQETDDSKTIVSRTHEFKDRPQDIYPFFEFRVSLSQNKKVVAYGEEFVTGVEIYNFETGQSKKISSEQINSLSISPDAKFIAIIKGPNLSLITLADNSVKQLTNYEFPKENYDKYFYPHGVITWASDSSFYYYYGNYGQGALKQGLELYSYNIKSNESRRVVPTNELQKEFYLDSNKDGIYYAQQDGFDDHVTRLNLKTHAVESLSNINIGGPERYVKVSPDQRFIAFERADSNYKLQIWLADYNGINQQKILDDASRLKW